MMQPPLKTYRLNLFRKRIFLAVGIVLLLILGATGVLSGTANLELNQVFGVIRGEGDPIARQIITNIRMPRVLSAVLAGMMLAVAGAAMQSLLRNPLGSPFTLGISNAAAFGAASAVVLFGAGTTHSNSTDAILIDNPYLITICAFAASLVATLIILAVTRLRNAGPETIILTGIMSGSLFTAGTTALQFVADDVQIAAIVFWTFGDLGRAGWREFWVMLAVAIPTIIYFIYNRWNYNALDAGDETAVSLGVRVNTTRTGGMIVASLSTAIAVSFFGIIAFVGLVVPHIVRAITGSDERFLIPASVLYGGIFLLFSDTLARTLMAPMVLPVGILTSFIGAPLFLYLLIKRRRRML
jgi:iron complex transport system permease protein